LTKLELNSFFSGKSGPYNLFISDAGFVLLCAFLFSFPISLFLFGVSNKSPKSRLAKIPFGGKRLNVFELWTLDSTIFSFLIESLVKHISFSFEFVNNSSLFNAF